MRPLQILTIALCLSTTPALAEDKNPFHANIVLFVKEGQDVPKAYQGGSGITLTYKKTADGFGIETSTK
jgi:hypothetical protein